MRRAVSGSRECRAVCGFISTVPVNGDEGGVDSAVEIIDASRILGDDPSHRVRSKNLTRKCRELTRRLHARSFSGLLNNEREYSQRGPDHDRDRDLAALSFEPIFERIAVRNRCR